MTILETQDGQADNSEATGALVRSTAPLAWACYPDVEITVTVP